MSATFPGEEGGTPNPRPSPAEALDELCERRAFLQVATPYLDFPAHALERRGEELRLRITMTKDFVTRTLGTQILRIRFPWGLGVAGGPVKILGYEQEENRRILRLRIPAELMDEDRRRVVRLEPPAAASATLNPDGRTLVRAKVEDLSALGLRVFALEPLNEAFVDNHLLQLSLGLEHGPRLEAHARLVHQDGQSLGLVFQGVGASPGIGVSERLDLEAYLLPELEKLKHRWQNRAALRAAAAARAKPKAAPEGILLLGRDRALETDLVQALPDEIRLRHCPPALAPLRVALEQPPKLVLLHVVKSGVEERFRLKSLVEALPAATPLVLLGAPGLGAGRELAAELKAAAYAEWNPAQTAFLSRLLQGLVRKHWGAEE